MGLVFFRGVVGKSSAKSILHGMPIAVRVAGRIFFFAENLTPYVFFDIFFIEGDFNYGRL